MENIGADFEWDKSHREGWRKVVAAQNMFLPPPPSKMLSTIPEWHNIWKLRLRAEEAANENKLVTTKVKQFIPGKVFFPKEIDSCLNKRQQAICLSVLCLYQSGFDLNRLTARQQEDILLYKALQSKIQEENAKFLEYVQSDWKERRRRTELIKATLRTYAYNQWKEKLKRSLSYAQFYKPVDVIPLTVQEHDPPVDVTRLQDILQLGTIAKFSCPSLSSKYTFKVSTMPPAENEHTYNSKLPVSQDAHVKTLVDNHMIDVVISSSTLKRLMDDSNFNVEWDIPVIVKKCDIKQADGSFESKNIVYIDKPLPKRHPDNVDFNQYCVKRLIKTNLCHIPEVVHPSSETTRMNPNYYKTATRISCETKVASSAVDDEDFVNQDEHVIHHNATYSIWNIKPSSEQNVLLKTKTCVKDKEIKVLVRSKMDACERLPNNSTRPLIIRPKLEFQLEYGASIPSKSELITEWTDLFFRPYSHLYRVLLQPSTAEVVSIDGVSMQQINSEAMNHYEYKPHLRLGTLYTIYSILTAREPGSYLLHHTSKIGPFVELLKEDVDTIKMDKSDLFNLHGAYSEQNCRPVSSLKRPWFPIDVHYILPVHSAFKRMPGMFKPLLIPFADIKRKKKDAKKKAKRGKKAKKDETPSTSATTDKYG